jgi:hypothetical protein
LATSLLTISPTHTHSEGSEAVQIATLLCF